MTIMNRRDALRLIGAAAVGCAAPTNPAAQPATMQKIPPIGLGTWQTFDVGSSAAARKPLEEVLEAFVELGGTLVDSSPMYGRSEEVVGAIAAKHDLHSKLFLATKVWTSGKRHGVEQMEESMRKLRVKTIDLMQVHNLLDVDAHLDTLDEWKRAGRVRFTGITHYTAGSHDDVARVMRRRPVDFIQINYSVAEREVEQTLLPLALERGVKVIANRPFASGGLFRRLRGTPLPSWAAEIDCASWAQVLLKFVISHPAITCAIPATSRVEHLRDNMGAAAGRLPDRDFRARIASAVS